MSDLAATNCGCECGGNDTTWSGANGSWIWIILLLTCCCGGNSGSFLGRGNDGCGCSTWLILLLLMCCCGGDNNGCGCF